MDKWNTKDHSNLENIKKKVTLKINSIISSSFEFFGRSFVLFEWIIEVQRHIQRWKI